ncbi:Uncharacterised protein [Mycobacterium tuberculosis]|nr:Uncharacterised protein [Mycobacterium tuberculosis]
MAVQGHGRCGVSEKPLHDFDISARTDRQRRRGVPQPVRDQVGNANRLASLVEGSAVLLDR